MGVDTATGVLADQRHVPRQQTHTRQRRRVSGRALLVAATLAAFALRLALAWPMTGPIVVPDEMGYLAQARWLAGDDSTLLTESPYYHLGYPLLLLPAALLGGDDPERFWRLLLVTNAAIGATLVPLLTVLLRRTLDTGPRLAAVAAFVASCHPGFVLPAGQGWGEIAFPPAVLLWVLAVSQVFQRPRWRSGLLVGLAAVAVWSVHSRAGLPVLVATALVVLAALAVRRLPLRAALGVAVSAAVAGVAVARAQAAALAALWDDTPVQVADASIRAVLTPSAAAPFAAQLGGTLWNALVSTAGLAVLGLAALGAVALRSGRPAAARATAATALLGALGVWALAALFFVKAGRADQFLHGRYVETVLALPLAAGVVVLATARTRRQLLRLGAVAVLLTVACAVVVRRVRGDLLETAVHFPFSTNSAMLPSLDPTRVQLETATVTGVAATVVVLAVAAARRWAGVVAVTALLLASTAYTATQVYWPLNASRYAGWTTPPTPPGVEEVAISAEEGFWFEQRAYHFWMPGVRLRQVDLATEPQPAWRYVLAPPSWPGAHRPGTRLVWTNNHGTVALYDQGQGTTR